MQKFIRWCVVLSVFLLSGCTTQVARLPLHNDKAYPTNDNAILVVKLDNFDYLDITKIDENALPVTPPVQYRILKPQRLFIASYAKSMYAITPGTYYISFIAIDSDKGVYYSEAPGLDAQGTVAYGAFTVRPGEVIYLGDLECQWRSTNKVKKLSLLHKLAEVKKDLDLAGHPDLAAKIVDAKFFPRGANIKNVLHLEPLESQSKS